MRDSPRIYKKLQSYSIVVSVSRNAAGRSYRDHSDLATGGHFVAPLLFMEVRWLFTRAGQFSVAVVLVLAHGGSSQALGTVSSIIKDPFTCGRK